MKILVTGGAGFIGSQLSKRLLERGYEVLSYDLKASNVCKTVVGDITDSEATFNAVKKSDYVFHLAATANLDFARLHPDVAIKTNVDGTYMVAKCCSQLDIPLSFASTACVYGNTSEHPSNEESVCVPTDIYGTTKVVGEAIIKGFHKKSGLIYNVLRFGTTYGPSMRKELAVYIFIDQALRGEHLTIHGSGLQTRCMIYIDDLLDAMVKVLERGVNGETLNLATEEELSVLQIANMVLEETGRSKGMFKFVEDRPGQIMKEQINVSKAKKLLSWTPKVNFKDGLKRTIKWIQNEWEERDSTV